MDTGTTQLDDLVPERVECFEIKFLRRVITKVTCRVHSRLQTISAHDLSRRQVLHDQVVTDGIKRVLVSAGGERLCQSLVELEVEHFESQGLRGMNFLHVPC